MKQQIKQKKIIVGFAVFLGLMWLCTLISKSIYASGLPQVLTAAPEKRSIEHKVETDGIVRQGSDVAIHTEEGLRVEKIFIREGDEVEKGTELFQVEMEDLKEKIAEKELAIAKLKYEMSDVQKNKELAAQEKEEQMNRAKEDYDAAGNKAETGVNRADETLLTAQERLQKHLENGVDTTSEEERKKANASYEDWVQKGTGLSERVAGQEKIYGDAGQAADAAAAVSKQAEDALTAAVAKSAAAGEKTAAAETKVSEAEKQLADASLSGSVPDPALQQAVDAAKAELEAAKAEEETAKTEETAAKTEKEKADGTFAQAKQTLEEAKNGVESVKKELEVYQESPETKPDFSSEDSEKKAWEDSKESLEDGVKSAEYAKEDAQAESGDLLKQAERNVEDTTTPEKADSTLKIEQMELEQLQEDLEKYKKMEKNGGTVTGEISGTVTAIHITAGERTPDGSAIVCADRSQPYRFLVTLTKDQKKYMNQGDAVTVELLKGNKYDLKVDYLTEDESSPGAYRAVIYLPEDTGSIGMSGTMEKSEASEIYDCCVPADALYSENSGTRYYVYTAGEREGILGKELYVEKRAVKVLEQNEQYAALEPGILTQEDMVITGFDKEIKANDVIRYQE